MGKPEAAKRGGDTSAPARGRPAVFLDRDGVIVRGELRNGKSYAPRRLEDFRLLPGARDAIAALHGRGFLVIVVTNQPDIGNGLVDPAVVESMHARMRSNLLVDHIETCPHRQDENCACRKPKPGLLVAAAARFHIDLPNSIMVGDRASDIVAGRSVGCYTIFVNRGYDLCVDVRPDAVVRSLPQAVRHILGDAACVSRLPV